MPWRRMTTPWNGWMRSLVPSTTLTWTFSVSPGANWGMSSRRLSASMMSVGFMARLSAVVCRQPRAPGRSPSPPRAVPVTPRQPEAQAYLVGETRIAVAGIPTHSGIPPDLEGCASALLFL